MVRRWSPSLHTFFFFVGELTITLEDVVNNLLLPVFGDKSPFNIWLSAEDITIDEWLFKHFSGHTASPKGKPARMGKWVAILSKEKDESIRQVGFLVLWLSKFFFSKFPSYGVKSVLFFLAIRLAQGTKFPLALCSWVISIPNWTCFMVMEFKVTLVTPLFRLFIVLFCKYLCGIIPKLLWQNVRI